MREEERSGRSGSVSRVRREAPGSGSGAPSLNQSPGSHDPRAFPGRLSGRRSLTSLPVAGETRLSFGKRAGDAV